MSPLLAGGLALAAQDQSGGMHLQSAVNSGEQWCQAPLQPPLTSHPRDGRDPVVPGVMQTWPHFLAPAHASFMTIGHEFSEPLPSHQQGDNSNT